MLPPTLDELLALDHPGRFVAEFVDALDRDGLGAELGVEIEGEVLGAPAYHPRALLSVCCTGTYHETGCARAGSWRHPCRDQIPPVDAGGSIRTTTRCGGSTKGIGRLSGSCSSGPCARLGHERLVDLAVQADMVRRWWPTPQ